MEGGREGVRGETSGGDERIRGRGDSGVDGEQKEERDSGQGRKV